MKLSQNVNERTEDMNQPTEIIEITNVMTKRQMKFTPLAAVQRQAGRAEYFLWAEKAELLVGI